MHWSERLDRFQLDDQDAVHEQIDATLTDDLSLVFHRNHRLALKFHPALLELESQGFFVDRLEKSRSQCAVNFTRGVHYRGSKPIKVRVGLAQRADHVWS
jgi:hypothetical protein